MNLTPEVGKQYVWRGNIWAIWEYTPRGFLFVANELGSPHHDSYVDKSLMAATGWSELTLEERARLL